MSLSIWSERVVHGGDLTSDDEREQSAERFAWTHPGPLTIALLGVCVLIALPTIGDAPSPPALTLRLQLWGAKINGDIVAGDWWRLLSTAFLHASWRHLLLNAYALFVVGSLVERWFGRARLLNLFVLSALGGSVASFYFSSEMSVGASGAIFGLVGASLFVMWRGRQNVLALVSARALAGLGIWGASCLIDGLNSARIDNAGHVGGLLAGVLVAACLPEGRIARAAAALCAVALAWTGVMVASSVSRTSARERQFEEGMIALRAHDTATFHARLVAAGRYQPALVLLSMEELESGNHDAALRDADSALALHCSGALCPQARLQRAKALLGLRRYEEMLFALERSSADENEAQQRETVILRAIALHSLHRNQEALAITEDANAWPDSDAIRRVRGVRARAQREMGHHTDAAREYASAAVSSSDAESWLSARVEYMMAGDTASAASALASAAKAATRAVDSTRGDPSALHLLGTVRRLERRCEEAAQAFARARMLRSTPNEPGEAIQTAPVRIWVEDPSTEPALVIRAQNLRQQRFRLTKIRLVECANVRESCNVPLDPCIELPPGGSGEFWVYGLDAGRKMSFRPLFSWFSTP